MRIRNLISFISPSVVTWAARWSHNFLGGVTFSGPSGTAQVASITGAAQTVTPADGTTFLTITVTTNDAFTLAVPAGAALGRMMVVLISNTTGGAMGAVTFGATYLSPTAFTEPATMTSKAITFVYNGTVWVEIAVNAADLS